MTRRVEAEEHGSKDRGAIMIQHEMGRVWGEARNDLARIQDISIWPLLVAWPAGTLLGLSVAFF